MPNTPLSPLSPMLKLVVKINHIVVFQQHQPRGVPWKSCRLPTANRLPWLATGGLTAAGEEVLIINSGRGNSRSLADLIDMIQR